MVDVLSLNNVDLADRVLLITISSFTCAFTSKDSKDAMVFIDDFSCGGSVWPTIALLFIDRPRIEDIDEECAKKSLRVVTCCGLEAKSNVLDDQVDVWSARVVKETFVNGKYKLSDTGVEFASFDDVVSTGFGCVQNSPVGLGGGVDLRNSDSDDGDIDNKEGNADDDVSSDEK